MTLSHQTSRISALISAAITMAGSEAKLGKLAGFSQNAIWYAKRNGRCSAELAIGIERATNGAISRSRLRPDLFPVEAGMASFATAEAR